MVAKCGDFYLDSNNRRIQVRQMSGNRREIGNPGSITRIHVEGVQSRFRRAKSVWVDRQQGG